MHEQREAGITLKQEHRCGGSESVAPETVDRLKQQLARMSAPYPAPNVEDIKTTAQITAALEQRRRYKPKSKAGELFGRGPLIVEFLRLPNDPAAARRFQADHPRYFPAKFWEEVLPSDEAMYGRSGVKGSSVFLAIPADLAPTTHPMDCPGCQNCTAQHWQRRPARPETPFWQGYRDLLMAAWTTAFPYEYVHRLLNAPTPGEDLRDYVKRRAPKGRRTRSLAYDPVYPFQKDIVALVGSTWRAKICEWCRSPFVADKPARRYCPERFAPAPKVTGEPKLTCARAARLDGKLDHWNRNKPKYRPPASPSGAPE